MSKYANQIETLVSRLRKKDIIQLPNPPIIAFAIFAGLAAVTQQGSGLRLTLSLLAYGCVFTWAWLEIFYGANIFRRILGLLSLCIIVWVGSWIILID